MSIFSFLPFIFSVQFLFVFVLKKYYFADFFVKKINGVKGLKEYLSLEKQYFSSGKILLVVKQALCVLMVSFKQAVVIWLTQPRHYLTQIQHALKPDILVTFIVNSKTMFDVLMVEQSLIGFFSLFLKGEIFSVKN